MDRFFTVKWIRGDAKGTTDVLPMAWFKKEGAIPEKTHNIHRARGSLSPAKCSVKVRGKLATLNYEKFEKFNKPNYCDIGLLKIEFSSTKRTKINSIYWKEKGKEFVDRTDDVECDSISVQELEEFNDSVSSAMKLSEKTLRERISKAPRKPGKAEVARWEFARNTNVAALVRLLARGKCGDCAEDAPFLTTGGVPYLEVHHEKRLADGGEDTPDNAIALCPNCHRKRHFGVA